MSTQMDKNLRMQASPRNQFTEHLSFDSTNVKCTLHIAFARTSLDNPTDFFLHIL